jgi:hypothetical protein
MPSFRQTLPVQLIRMLDLHSEHGVPSFVAAASGLVRIGRRLHVIADDVLYLASFLDESVDLGSIDDVMLGWTDADVLGDQLIVSAAAERTDNAIDDGACRGSAIALIDWNGRVVQQHPLDGMHKVEGIAATARNGIIHLDLVTDNDDPASPAWHLRAQVA